MREPTASVLFMNTLTEKQQRPMQLLIWLGIVSMSLIGVISVWLGAGLAWLLLAVRRPKFRHHVLSHSNGVMLAFAIIYLLSPSVVWLVLFTVYFQILYYFNASKPTHYFWIIAVGFIHLAVIATITPSVIFPVILLCYGITLIRALMVSNLLAGIWMLPETQRYHELKRLTQRFPVSLNRTSYWLVALILCIGVFLFPFLPRFDRFSYHPNQFTEEGMTGFSKNVQLGDMGEIQQDNRVALRVFVPEHLSPRIQRWRGNTLETWVHSRRSWASGSRRYPFGQNSRGSISLHQQTPLDHTPDLIRVNCNSMVEPMVFLPEIDNALPYPVAYISGGVYQISFEPWGFTLDLSSEYQFRSYDYVIGLAAQEKWDDLRNRIFSPPEEVLKACLSLEGIPPKLLEQLSERSNQILDGFNTDQISQTLIARRLSSELSSSQEYSLDFSRKSTANSLEEFIFERKAGHCEFFATTLALLLRVNGIPSRLVTGYQSGEPNFIGNYQVIRQSDAHSWVEAWCEPQGWLVLDPTPSDSRSSGFVNRNVGFLFDLHDYVQLLWSTHVLDYSQTHQKDFLSRVYRVTGRALFPLVYGTIYLYYLRYSMAAALAVVFMFWLAGKVWRFRRTRSSLSGKGWFWWWRLPRFRLRPRTLASHCLYQIEKTAKSKGFLRLPHETAQFFVQRVMSAFPNSIELCNRFIVLYHSCRYRSMDESDYQQMETELRSVTIKIRSSLRKKR